MYKIKATSVFKKELKLMIKRGKDISKLKEIVNKLAKLEEIDEKYHNHMLQNDKRFKNCNELHIEPNWLLVYKYINDTTLVLMLIETGSHSDLFNK